jgi:hypothetical protein
MLSIRLKNSVISPFPDLISVLGTLTQTEPDQSSKSLPFPRLSAAPSRLDKLLLCRISQTQPNRNSPAVTMNIILLSHALSNQGLNQFLQFRNFLEFVCHSAVAPSLKSSLSYRSQPNFKLKLGGFVLISQLLFARKGTIHRLFIQEALDSNYLLFRKINAEINILIIF